MFLAASLIKHKSRRYIWFPCPFWLYYYIAYMAKTKKKNDSINSHSTNLIYYIFCFTKSSFLLLSLYNILSILQVHYFEIWQQLSHCSNFRFWCVYVHRIVLQSFEKSPVCLLLVCLPSCRKCWCGAFFAVIVLTVLVVTANNACKIVSLIYAYVYKL